MCLEKKKNSVTDSHLLGLVTIQDVGKKMIHFKEINCKISFFLNLPSFCS
jgi:hypothetical protein